MTSEEFFSRVHSRLFLSSALKKIFEIAEQYQKNFFDSAFKIIFEFCTQENFWNGRMASEIFFKSSFKINF